MKESAEIALSYVRSHADQLGIEKDAFEGALSRSRASGRGAERWAICRCDDDSALVSLLTGRPVRSVVGMTGEITLQGRVLPIGGVKQKVLAAHRAGLTEVVLPVRNGPDLEDLPEAVREATIDSTWPRRSMTCLKRPWNRPWRVRMPRRSTAGAPTRRWLPKDLSPCRPGRRHRTLLPGPPAAELPYC